LREERGREDTVGEMTRKTTNRIVKVEETLVQYSAVVELIGVTH